MTPSSSKGTGVGKGEAAMQSRGLHPFERWGVGGAARVWVVWGLAGYTCRVSHGLEIVKEVITMISKFNY